MDIKVALRRTRGQIGWVRKPNKLRYTTPKKRRRKTIEGKIRKIVGVEFKGTSSEPKKKGDDREIPGVRQQVGKKKPPTRKQFEKFRIFKKNGKKKRPAPQNNNPKNKKKHTTPKKKPPLLGGGHKKESKTLKTGRGVGAHGKDLLRECYPRCSGESWGVQGV